MPNPSNYKTWIQMLSSTMARGAELEIRGSKVREVMNNTIVIDPLYPFMDFRHRNLNPTYTRRELIWKIGADPFDSSICRYAKMWRSVVNKDGSYNSNYGQYWFGKQQGLLKAVAQLERDKFSRRAIIPMLKAEHVEDDVIDTVCTESVGFFIRDDKLHCLVHMRSSDQIFGLGTDMPSFAFIQRLALGVVQESYPEVELGNLSITAMSSHIYERHFDMVNAIVEDPHYNPIRHDTMMPFCNSSEAISICSAGSIQELTPQMGPLTAWLLEAGYDPSPYEG